jgi:hypothetical protein
MTNQTARGKQQTANRTPRVGAIAVSLFRRLISHCRLLFAFSMFARRLRRAAAQNLESCAVVITTPVRRAATLTA